MAMREERRFPGLRLAAEAMRTRFEMVLCDTDTSEAELRAAGEEALNEIAEAETRLSAYRTDSDLFRVNAWAGQKAVRVDAPLFAFLQQAAELTRQTAGAFDMTVGPLKQLWATCGANGRTPTPQEIEAVLTLVGMNRLVELDADAQTVRFTRPGVRLDPGAIGKGYALERAADRLREIGVRTALLHGGTSTVVATGTPVESPDGWPIALQHPRQADTLLTTFFLKDCALSVSALHGQTFYVNEGRSFGHLLDPRTGYPVEDPILAACLLPSATETDALSTALLVEGSKTKNGEASPPAFLPEGVQYVIVRREDSELRS